MQKNYPVITLCGSTRFKQQFMEAQKKLTLDGNIVISVGLFGHSGDDEVWEQMDEGTLTKTKAMLDNMHKRKIDMSDEIFVINVDGYIGESTKSEIEYAKINGKKISYLEPIVESDLERILSEIICEYGKNEDFKRPTISWSTENMVSRYAEYQYWINHIVVSNLLDTDKVSDEAKKMVIYHEYLHQLTAEHDDLFWNKMDKMNNWKKYEKELDEYINSLQEFPIKKSAKITLDENQEVIFCKFPFNESDFDSYWKHLLYYNHNITGFLAGNIPEKYCDDTIKQLVWVVDYQNMTYIIGWCKNVKLYSSMQKIPLLGKADILELQFKYKIDDGCLLLPCNLFVALNEGEQPKKLISDGICSSNDIDKKIVIEIVQSINSYSQDYHVYGISDSAIDSVSCIEINDVKRLITIAKKEKSTLRSIWIMNKAVHVEKSFRTYATRAEILEQGGIIDRAIEDLKCTLQYDEGKADESKIKRKIKGLEGVNARTV